MSACLDHIAEQVTRDIAQGKEPGESYTPAMQALYKDLTEDLLHVEDEYSLVFHIRKSKYQCEILESLLLSKCPYELINEQLGVPELASKAYEELYFDTGEFRTKLDLLEYLEDYDDEFGKDLKHKALTLGYEYVLFNFANLIPKGASQKRLVEKMFMATAYKAMAMNVNPLKSDANKQAVKHAELMIKAFDILQKANAEDISQEYDLTMLLASDKTSEKTLAVPKLNEIK